MSKVTSISEENNKEFDHLALHPLQSWAWGEFRKKQGQKVIRLGRFENKKLVEIAQFSVHRIPHTPWTIGYLPRGGIPSAEMIEAIRKEGLNSNCIFIKFEPNVLDATAQQDAQSKHLRSLGLRPGKSLFTPYTFQVDLAKSEQELLASMKPKTRYNIGIAQKHGVEVVEDNSEEAFEAFQRLTEETAARQHFFSHNKKYRKLMWYSMRDAGIARLLVARYKNEILTTWILFFFNKIGYYPYGASSSENREAMASNLIAWRALQLAKAAGCRIFDFWGSLGPNPDITDPWYGFHRFKEGYGGKLVEFVGTWDLMINPTLCGIYNVVDQFRWRWLRRTR